MTWGLGVAIGLVVGLLAVMLVAFRRASRRVRGELGAFRAAHRDALATLVDDAAGVAWAPPEGAGDGGWAAIASPEGGVTIRIGVARVMRKTTFIEYVTRMTLTPAEGGEGASGGAGAGTSLPEALRERLARVATCVGSEVGRLVVDAAVAGPTLRRYSYSLRLQLDPDALLELLAAGRELARCLQGEEA